MLRRLRVQGFKSLHDVDVKFPPLTVLFGPNAAGKSNLLEAVHLLSRLAVQRTLADVFTDPIRGYPLEAFRVPPGGLPALFHAEYADLTLEADLETQFHGKTYEQRYRVTVRITPSSGTLSVQDEYLANLRPRRGVLGRPVIERIDRQLHLRRKGKPAHPRQEPVGLNHTLLSDPRWSGDEYTSLEACRQELENWRLYYLDPRVAMRLAHPPADVRDVGLLGMRIAPFLYRLRHEKPKDFTALRRTLRGIIPHVEDLTVDLDERRGTLDVQVQQGGVMYPSRIISEGTLRVLALCAVAVNPWSTGLISFEEPENGVHPRRLELIAQLLWSLARDQQRQVIVTTHSLQFCSEVLRLARENPQQVALLQVRQDFDGTRVESFGEPWESLHRDAELRAALNEQDDESAFPGVLLRGYLDD